jgi:hypothetical protein
MRLSHLLGMLLVAGSAVAAPAPSEEKPKPRPKLLGTLKLDKRVEQAVWTPDAKHLILVADGKGLVVGRDQLGEDAAPKPVAEFDLPAGGGSKFGVTPDGAELFAVTSAGYRFNAETRLCFWTLKDLLDGKKKAKPDRVVSLEADNPTSFALAAGGRSLYASVSEPRAGGGNQPNGIPMQVGKVLRLSTRTGDLADEVLTLDEPDGSLVGAVLHPESGRVFAHFQVADQHVIRCLDVATKKAKWERKFEQAPAQPLGYLPKGSPDGKVLVAFCTRQFQAPQPGAVPPPGQPVPLTTMVSSSPHLLNAATGEPIADLGGDDVYSSDVCDFSRDGRLVFGYLSRAGGMQYLVWDAKTGKPLKTWNRGSGNLSAAFAPTGHELAVIERTEVPVYAAAPAQAFDGLWNGPPPGGGQFGGLGYIQPAQQVIRTDHTSVIGVWDLAPLVK